MAVIEVEHLTKRFGKVLAVDDVSFALKPGTITGFLGPNGAGKTTTLRMIVDLVRPTQGTARVLGGPYRDLARPWTRVGSLLDASGFHPGRSGRNALRVVARASGIPDARVEEVLEMVELTGAAKRAVKGYSTGMRQRLALGCVLLGDPEVLLLDEPANGLDPEGIAWLRGFLRWLADRGRTVLVSSHLLAEMAQIADDVVIIDRGRLVRAAPLEQLLGGFAPTVRVRSPQRADLEVALATEGLHAATDGDDLVLTGTTAEHVGDVAARAGITLHRLSAQQPDLEEVFLQLVADGRRADP